MFDREENYMQVRIAAFDGPFMTIMNYVLAVIAHDPSRITRRFVARCGCLISKL
jgi:transcription initiation factor TFIID subunit 2